MIVARGADGATAVYAPAENVHRDGILAVTTVPSPHVTSTLETDLVAATLRIAHALDYVGVLCVEFFVVRDGDGLRLLVNEIAPRPHNSGHYTIDACVTSQFAQQARIAAGLPLGETRRHSAAVMLNLLGDLWFADGRRRADASPTGSRCCRHAGANLHLYGKREAASRSQDGPRDRRRGRPGRGDARRARDRRRARHRTVVKTRVARSS